MRRIRKSRNQCRNRGKRLRFEFTQRFRTRHSNLAVFVVVQDACQRFDEFIRILFVLLHQMMCAFGPHVGVRIRAQLFHQCEFDGSIFRRSQFGDDNPGDLPLFRFRRVVQQFQPFGEFFAPHRGVVFLGVVRGISENVRPQSSTMASKRGIAASVRRGRNGVSVRMIRQLDEGRQ